MGKVVHYKVHCSSKSPFKKTNSTKGMTSCLKLLLKGKRKCLTALPRTLCEWCFHWSVSYRCILYTVKDNHSRMNFIPLKKVSTKLISTYSRLIWKVKLKFNNAETVASVSLQRNRAQFPQGYHGWLFELGRGTDHK